VNRRTFALGSAAILFAGPVSAQPQPAQSEYDRLPRLAEELVRIPVDVIVSFSEGAEAAARATRSIPIVMGGHVRPVEAGWYRHWPPRRNVTV